MAETITDYVGQGEIIDVTLAELDDDDVTIEFPAGSYKLSRFHTRSDNIELIAPNGDATLEIIPGGSSVLDFSGDGWEIEGFEFDFNNTHSKTLKATGSGWDIRNCVWRGGMEWGGLQTPQAIAARVEYPRGEGRIVNCYFQDGSNSGTGIRVLPNSHGSLELVRSWFEEWSDGAFQTPPAHGPVDIRECYIENTTSALRMTGPISVRLSQFVSNGASPPSQLTGRDEIACWVDGSKSDFEQSVYLEACEFDWTYEGGYPVDALSSGDEVTLYLCRFHNETTMENVAVGGGRLDVYRCAVSGSSGNLREEGGIVGTVEFDEFTEKVVSDSAPISAPPPEGETPKEDYKGTPSIGKMGGSYGRFYNASE